MSEPEQTDDRRQTTDTHLQIIYMDILPKYYNVFWEKNFIIYKNGQK